MGLLGPTAVSSKDSTPFGKAYMDCDTGEGRAFYFILFVFSCCDWSPGVTAACAVTQAHGGGLVGSTIVKLATPPPLP